MEDRIPGLVFEDNPIDLAMHPEFLEYCRTNNDIINTIAMDGQPIGGEVFKGYELLDDIIHCKYVEFMGEIDYSVSLSPIALNEVYKDIRKKPAREWMCVYHCVESEGNFRLLNHMPHQWIEVLDSYLDS